MNGPFPEAELAAGIVSEAPSAERFAAGYKINHSLSRLLEDWNPHIGSCFTCRFLGVQMLQASTYGVIVVVSPLRGWSIVSCTEDPSPQGKG